MLVDVACVLASALAFLAFPHVGAVRESYIVAGLFRAIWCGLVAGLVVRDRSWQHAGLVAVIAATLGVLAIRLGLRSIAAWEMPVAVALAGAVAAATELLDARGWRRASVWVALAIVLLGLVWQIGLLPGPFAKPTRAFLVGVATEPVAESYHFDGQLFLKTIFLMKRGEPYYSAFGKAMTQDSRFNAPPPLVLNYREPWVARFVALLPGNAGLDAWATFLVLAIGAILGAYLLASQFLTPGAALLGPMLLVSYFSWSLTTKWFPLSELWAGALAVWVVVAFSRERWWTAAILVLAAVAIRELMVYLIPVGAIAWAFYPERKRVVTPMIALVALPMVVLGYHVMSAPGAFGSGSSGGISTWLHASPTSLAAALRFSSNYMPWGKLAMLGIPVFALAGAAFVPCMWRKAMFVAVIGVPLVALSLFSSGAFGNYWGGIIQPIVLAIMPLVFIPLLSKTEASDVLAATTYVAEASQA